MSTKTKNNKQNMAHAETWWHKWQAYIIVAGFGLFVVWVYFSFLVTDMKFVDGWTDGHYPFIFFLLKEVIVYSLWGGMFLIPGIIVPIAGFYLIITKKAVDSKKLLLPATLFTLLFLGIAYAFFGFDWNDNVADSLDYFKNGAEEQVIILEDYEIDYPSGMYGGAIDYVYTSEDGEEFITNSDFEIKVSKKEKYAIRYLPRTKYIVGINHLNNEDNS